MTSKSRIKSYHMTPQAIAGAAQRALGASESSQEASSIEDDEVIPKSKIKCLEAPDGLIGGPQTEGASLDPKVAERNHPPRPLNDEALVRAVLLQAFDSAVARFRAAPVAGLHWGSIVVAASALEFFSHPDGKAWALVHVLDSTPLAHIVPMLSAESVRRQQAALRNNQGSSA